VAVLVVVVQERVVEMLGAEGSVLLRCRDICGGCVNDDGMGVLSGDGWVRGKGVHQ